MSDNMKYIRSRLGLRRKDRFSGLVTVGVNQSGGAISYIGMNPHDIHTPFAIPVFTDAGVLTNQPIQDDYPFDVKTFFPFARNPNITVSCTVDIESYAQMIAKIGLGIAVARYGVDGFEPLVRDFIRCHPGQYGHWVGTLNAEGGKPTNSTHTIVLQKNIHTVALL